LLALIAATLLSCSPAEAKEFTTVAFTVGAGDTMDSIAQTYLPPDRGNSYQAFAEFREGIYEYNYDRVFLDRDPYEVRVGDCLLITLWK
jgi:hypothetical protein